MERKTLALCIGMALCGARVPPQSATADWAEIRSANRADVAARLLMLR